MTTRRIQATQARQKRLGQYFTPPELAHLLAELAKAELAESIIDPMAGAGVMLAACDSAGAHGAARSAIELDPRAMEQLARNPELADVKSHTGSAFATSCYEDLGWAWDLVISNPPYVRYQTSAGVNLDGVEIPSSSEIREGLKAAIRANPCLDSFSRQVLLRATDYSGQSDLAVPSWILASMLVKPGGRLALVVPDTWLSRDYAEPVMEVLRQLFDVELIVEDASATWFAEASVRTTLIVGRRRSENSKAEPKIYKHVRISSSVADDRSLVGLMFKGHENPDRAFAEWLHTSAPGGQILPRGVTVEVHSDFAGARIKEEHGDDLEAVRLSPSVQRLVGRDIECVSLHSLGWMVGQGLRTGANEFFYLRPQSNGAFRSPITGEVDLKIDSCYLRKAIRRQSEITEAGGRARLPKSLDNWRLLYIGDLPHTPTGDLNELIRVAEKTHHDGMDGPTIPELSAVRVNVRKGDAKRGMAPRSWYQLPELAPRHTPELFVPRVNSGSPRFFLNSKPKRVVDANFSSLWRASKSAPPPLAMLAFLSSTWVAAHLEFSSTALGGGALKVEAAHVRRIPVPQLSPADWSALELLGADLVRVSKRDEVVVKIDEIIGRTTRTLSKLPKITRSLSTRIEDRTQKKGSGNRGLSN